MRLAPALITAAALLLPNLAMADDCAPNPLNLAVSAQATQQNGMWQLDIRLTLVDIGSGRFLAQTPAAFLDIYAGGTRVQRIQVGAIFTRQNYSASFPVDDQINRARVEFVVDPASRNDGEPYNHDCNSADNVVNLRLN